MDWKVFLVTFGTIFLAELGDKTQLVALSMTAQSGSPLSVAAGACLALVVATLIGVAVGGLLAQWISPLVLKRIAAGVFIVIGVVMLLRGW